MEDYSGNKQGRYIDTDSLLRGSGVPGVAVSLQKIIESSSFSFLPDICVWSHWVFPQS